MPKKSERKDQNASEKQKECAEELNEEQLEEISAGALGLTGISGDAEVRGIRVGPGRRTGGKSRKRVRK